MLRCAWCGAELEVGSESVARVVRCAACGASTTAPWPSEEELDRAYAGWYRPAEGRFAGAGDTLLRWSRGRLARRIDRISPAGDVLDVGAGDAALLDALLARGRSAIGLERPSGPSDDPGNASDGPRSPWPAAGHADVRFAGIDEIDGPFAAVVFWHVLEHLRGPAGYLEQAASLLLPGGVLILAIPNSASVQAKAFGGRWLGLDLPRHLVHLPLSSLVARLRDLGLTVERVSHLRGGQVIFGWLHGLVGTLPGGLDLYDAIRRPAARRNPTTGAVRAVTLGAALVLLPLAATLALAEAVAGRGGTVYVEARRG